MSLLDSEFQFDLLDSFGYFPDPLDSNSQPGNTDQQTQSTVPNQHPLFADPSQHLLIADSNQHPLFADPNQNAQTSVPTRLSSGVERIMKRAPQRKLNVGEEMVEKQLKAEMDRIGFNPKECDAYKWLKDVLKLTYVKKEAAFEFANKIKHLIGVKNIPREYYRTFRAIIYWFHKNFSFILEAYHHEIQTKNDEQREGVEDNSSKEEQIHVNEIEVSNATPDPLTFNESTFDPEVQMFSSDDFFYTIIIKN